MRDLGHDGLMQAKLDLGWNCYSWKTLSSRHKSWREGLGPSQSVPGLPEKGLSRIVLDEPGPCPHRPPFSSSHMFHQAPGICVLVGHLRRPMEQATK